MVEIKASKHNF